MRIRNNLINLTNHLVGNIYSVVSLRILMFTTLTELIFARKN